MTIYTTVEGHTTEACAGAMAIPCSCGCREPAYASGFYPKDGSPGHIACADCGVIVGTYDHSQDGTLRILDARLENRHGCKCPYLDLETIICDRCGRETRDWPIKRPDVCSPKDWQYCIRTPENIAATKAARKEVA